MTAQELAKFLQILPASTNVYFNDELLTIEIKNGWYDIRDDGYVELDGRDGWTKIGNFLEDFNAVKQYFGTRYAIEKGDVKNP
jgi:hypothetical protein